MIIARVDKSNKDNIGTNVTICGACEDLAFELEAILVGLVRDKETIEVAMVVLNRVADMIENHEI